MCRHSFADAAERLGLHSYIRGYIILRNALLQAGVIVYKFLVAEFGRIGIERADILQQLNENLLNHQPAKAFAFADGFVKQLQVGK